MTGADLRHIDTWLFDLDNTLYPLESGLTALITPRITQFVMRVTGLAHEAAHALQKRWLAEEGLTLRGLMTHHDVDPDAYHAEVHAVPLDCLQPDPALRDALARLPGRRLIFTNADGDHADRVLARLGLTDLFSEVFHIGSAAFVPKPSQESFARIIAAHAITPATTAFFEDSQANLAPAAALGMTTVLIGAHAAGCDAPFVDYRAERLAPFLAAARLEETA